MKHKTISIKEFKKRVKEMNIYGDAPPICECCNKEKPGDIFQDDDLAWVCNFCYWTRTDRLAYRYVTPNKFEKIKK